MSKTKIGEWFWRFLAVAMLFSVGWMGWIIYQLNPPPLVMTAAFEAAAQAKSHKGTPSDKQGAQGVIAPSSAAESVSKAPEPPVAESTAAAPPVAAPSAAEALKEPPINAEKLKFSESIALPVPSAKK